MSPLKLKVFKVLTYLLYLKVTKHKKKPILHSAKVVNILIVFS